VAIGMASPSASRQRLGLCAPVDAARMANHLKAVGLPTELHDMFPAASATSTGSWPRSARTRRSRRGKLTFILARGIGESFIAHGVAAEEVTAFIEAELAGNGAAR
jgi:3-dehydroquinate synthetase